MTNLIEIIRKWYYIHNKINSLLRSFFLLNQPPI